MTLCQYYGICGGCTLQHIPYEIQLENKKNLLSKAINFQEIKVFHKNEYYYRNRMDLVFNPDGIGFRKKGTWHTVIDIEKCVISNEKLNQLIKEVRNFFTNPDSFHIKKHTGTLRYAVIRTPQFNSSISFVLNSESTRISEAIERIKEFSKITTADNILVTYVPPNTDVSISDDYFIVKGKDIIKEVFLEKTFFFPVQGFFQNNSEVAEMMHNYVNETLRKYNTKEYHLLDLYGGVGTFGIINSELFKKVSIIESVESAVKTAKLNIEENKIKNTEAILLDAKHLKKLNFNEKLFLITDPPRTGMHEKTIQRINELKPEVIIYISCNPNQLSKDLIKLKGYEIKSAALFDLFPQTSHSESVIELKSKVL